MFIESKKVGLREVRREDLELFKSWRNVEHDTRNYRTIGPLTTENQEWYWKNVVNNPDKHKVFTVVKNDTLAVIGEIRLSNINLLDGDAEIGILLNPKFRGQGYGSEALKLIVSFGFNRLRLHRIEAQYIISNTSSQRLFESCGFKLDGVRRESKYFDGKYNDVVMVSLLEREVR